MTHFTFACLAGAFAVATLCILLARAQASVRRARPSRPAGDRVRRILTAAAVAAATLCLGLDTGFFTELASMNSNGKSDLALVGTAHAGEAPALSGPESALFGARQWLNTPPLGPDDVRGKVVLVNFWTYSCINCLRVLPYVRTWAEKYKDQGLVVVGVHTPEFAFEKDAANVRRAATALGVGYPVAIDSDFAIWRAFGNHAWPALYFIDATGHVRGQAVGEGDYDRSERLIQKLLTEANGAPVATPVTAVKGVGPQAASDGSDVGSDETYVGYAQAENFASPGGAKADQPSLYRTGAALPLNHWGLDGTWTIGAEFATSKDPSGSITYRFHARDLHLVLGPGADGHPVRFQVTIDGAPPGASHGYDVDAEGRGTVEDNRLYQLVRQTGPVTDRTFEIKFLDPGVRAYSFTFG